MVGKTRSAVRLRGGVHKCEVCRRTFLSSAALKTHTVCSHSTSETSLATKSIRKPSQTGISSKKKYIKKAGKPNILLVKNYSGIVKPVMSTKNVSTPLPEVKVDLEKESNDEEANIVQKNVRKSEIVFKCPKCSKVFQAFFIARKHIQKFHSFNRKGEKLSPDALNLIKPERIEQLIEPTGQKKSMLESILMHTAEDTDSMIKDDSTIKNVFNISPEPVNYKGSCTCIGCNQHFANLRIFDLHIHGTHGDDILGLFFPEKVDYEEWRDDMERQMKSHYTIRTTNTVKELYYCSSTVAPTGTKQKFTTYMCPSNIVVREFTKGIQVHFYKQHFGHEHGKYILPNNYRKFLINSYINSDDEKPEEKDLYVQFKTLMECIILDAAKINVHSLKILIEKALDMSSILANYNEDDDIFPSKDPNSFKIITNKEKALTDKQITKALNAMMNSTKPKLTKRPNILTSTPKVGNVVVVPLPKKEESKRTVKEVLPAKRTNTIPVQEVTPAKHTRSKSVHFVSNVEKSPSITLVETPKSQISLPAKKTTLEEEIKKNDSKSVANSPKTNQEPQPSSFNDSYKVFVDTLNNTKTNIKNTSKSASNKTEKLKKSILKTKIGQFMPNTNKTSPNKSPIKSPVDSKCKFSKVKIDKYEVREQENDCNILILKI